MQAPFLILATVGLPCAYGVLIYLMRLSRVEQPPVAQMFFLFGTAGGWLLAIALSPSGLAAMCLIFLILSAPVVFVESLALRARKGRTMYHRVAMWGGFAYAPLLVLSFVLASLV